MGSNILGSITTISDLGTAPEGLDLSDAIIPVESGRKTFRLTMAELAAEIGGGGSLPATADMFGIDVPAGPFTVAVGEDLIFPAIVVRRLVGGVLSVVDPPTDITYVNVPLEDGALIIADQNVGTLTGGTEGAAWLAVTASIGTVADAAAYRSATLYIPITVTAAP